MGRDSLPPGFRFHPTDVELLRFYLKRKVLGKKLPSAIGDIDIYKYGPWDLPDKSCLRTGDLKWYFFCPRERKYASGSRINRSTDSGFWKTTGKDRLVHYKNEVTGTIKTLIFHTGKPPKGDRTDWVMHEYKLEDKKLSDLGIVQDNYVLCAIFKKEGPGPKNGAQYGAPFNEEDWDDELQVNGEEDISSGAAAGPSTAFPSFLNKSVVMCSCVPETLCNEPSASCPSPSHASAYHSPIITDNTSIYTSAAAREDVNRVLQIGLQFARKVDTFDGLIAPEVVVNEDDNFASILAAEIVNGKDASAAMLDPLDSNQDNLSAMLAAFRDESAFSNLLGDQDITFFTGVNGNTDTEIVKDSENYGSNVEVAYGANGREICDTYGDVGILNGLGSYYGGKFLELSDLEPPLENFNEANVNEQAQTGGIHGDGHSHPNNSGQLSYPTNALYAAEPFSGSTEWPLLPNDSYCFDDQLDMFCMQDEEDQKIE